MSETLCGPRCMHGEKKNWGEGPWQQEPDRVDFRHAGFPCLLHRNHHGNWCGYVGLAPGHPFFGKPYDDVEVDVHGGLTYSDKCSPPICHVPEPGEPENLWWLGFDCGHLLDLSPGIIADLPKIGLAHHIPHHLAEETYRTVEYVRAETERLAEQLAATSPDRVAQADVEPPDVT
jgi:hypothetical protein